MTKKIHKASFDPMLFNGLGSKRERSFNHGFYGFIILFGYIFGMIGGSSIIYGTVTKKYYEDWFLNYYIAVICIVFVYVIVWFYLHILLFKHTKFNKDLNKTKPLLICEYKGSLKNYCVWILGFIFMLIFYLLFFVLSIVSPPLLCLILLHFYNKPFLLKRILLFEEYLILEYRIFGNIKLNRNNLALIRLNRLVSKSIMDYGANIALARVMIIKNAKNSYLTYYPCAIFSIYGMTNINILWQDLDAKMGYSTEAIANENFVYAGKKINFKIFTIYLKDNFNV
ncbi:hypothetical protein [Campylobacter troglodytis]|uniref:hypothetical protein n=1 Tax=Campylobacter troglodytis TaxID=654363 RepID=UPI00115BD62F|nr:hypothetical protein [Campylobacter troglodytis]TQR60539.1 hypothetical protein DMC01_05190 [Campylobacter troglodytis]